MARYREIFSDKFRLTLLNRGGSETEIFILEYVDYDWEPTPTELHEKFEEIIAEFNRVKKELKLTLYEEVTELPVHIREDMLGTGIRVTSGFSFVELFDTYCDVYTRN